MNNFQRILDLVRRTGDKMVVTDPNGDDAYVIMDLDEYELMLAESGLIDEPFADQFFDDLDPAGIDEEFLFDEEPALQASETTADLSPEDKLEDVLGEEEQFYLEPVE